MRTFYRLPRARINCRLRCRLLANEPFWFVLVSDGNPDRTRESQWPNFLCLGRGSLERRLSRQIESVARRFEDAARIRSGERCSPALRRSWKRQAIPFSPRISGIL